MIGRGLWPGPTRRNPGLALCVTRVNRRRGACMAGDDTAGLTITEAAEAWGVARDTVRRWVRTKAVEATRDNAGMWRVAPGQNPPPTTLGRRGPRATPGQPGDDPGRTLPASAPDVALAAELAAARTEAMMLREALADARGERDRLAELLRLALDRPPWWVRWARAVRGAGGAKSAI